MLDKKDLPIFARKIDELHPSVIGNSSVRVNTEKSENNNGIRCLVRGVSKEVAAALHTNGTLVEVLMLHSEETVEDAVINLIKSIAKTAMETKAQIIELLSSKQTIEIHNSKLSRTCRGTDNLDYPYEVKDANNNSIGCIRIAIKDVSPGFKYNVENYFKVTYEDILTTGNDIEKATMKSLIRCEPTDVYIQSLDES